MGDRLGIQVAVDILPFSSVQVHISITLMSSWITFHLVWHQNIALPPVRLELTAFRLWDWRAAYCATEADASCKFLLEINCIDLFICYSVIVIISVLSFIFSNHFFLNTLWYTYVAYMERYAAKCNENNHSTSVEFSFRNNPQLRLNFFPAHSVELIFSPHPL